MAKRSKRTKKRERERERKRRQKRRETMEDVDLQPRLTPRGEYTLFEHPTNIIQLEFPSDWHFGMEDELRSIQFAPKTRTDVALSCYVMPYHIDSAMIVESPKLVEFCEGLFKQANAVNPRRDSTIPYFAMKADRNQDGLGGHYWFVFGCDIFLGLTTQFPEGELHIWGPVFERVLSTFRIPREMEALFNRAKMRLAIKLHEEYPEQEYHPEGNEIKGKDRTVPLGNLLRRIKNAPEDWERFTDEFFETAVKVLHTLQLGDEKLDDVRGEIYPFIRADNLGPAESRLAKNEWLADLNITYVINIPSGFRYISEADLERWGIELEELHQLAIANLCELDNTTAEMPDIPAGALPFVMVAAGDNMEASRLLNPGLYGQFAESLGGPFIAAIPCRDALILFPNDKQLRRRVQQLVRKDYETSTYAITDRLFLVTRDGTTLAEW